MPTISEVLSKVSGNSLRNIDSRLHGYTIEKIREIYGTRDDQMASEIGEDIYKKSWSELTKSEREDCFERVRKDKKACHTAIKEYEQYERIGDKRGH